MPQIYVTAPTTVTVDWSTTGDKTLLTITDNLPAGNKIVLFALGWDAATNILAQGYLKIMTGSTVLVQEGITYSLNYGSMRAKHVMLFAYHANAPANAQYSFIVTVTTAATGSSTLHVQGMAILLTEPAFFTTGINTSIAAGETVTLATVNTNFPAGSKVAVLAYVIMGVATTTGANRLYAAGNIRILKGSTIVSQNQFQVGTYADIYPAFVSLSYLDTNSGANQDYSIQVYNSLSETSQAWGEIIAFRVGNGAFLDTGSVALTSGSQVTVGNLTTIMSEEVGVIALAAAENTSTADATAFNAGDVVLQLNNQETGQVANQRGWYIRATSYNGRSGVYSLFRVDTGVSNPSYQVKMTARADGINGEAKILAFTIAVIMTVSDSGAGVETVDIRASVAVSDAGAGVEYAVAGLSRTVEEYGYGAEVIDTSRSITDSGVCVELVNTEKEVFDVGAGVEFIYSPVFNVISDSSAGVETTSIALPLSDAGLGVELINMSREVRELLLSSELVNMVKSIVEQALGVEIVSTAKQVFDAGAGVDTVGIVATVTVADYGSGVEFADSFLSIYGYITIDGVEQIGRHSIPYKDLKRDGLPIQVKRRSVEDRVLLDNDDIGNMTVEWDDKVSDITSGYRFIRVLGTVRIVD